MVFPSGLLKILFMMCINVKERQNRERKKRGYQNNGAELVGIQELLGHSSPDITLRYAKINHERKREQHKRYLIQ